VVIGSGFAGAVTACRLAEAHLRVCVLERGRRFNAETDFPVYPRLVDTNVPPGAGQEGRNTVQPDVSRLFWRLGNGVWDFRDLGDVVVGQAAGYGGGSLIYANVHLRPPAHVFDERWPIDRGELDPYFDLAAEMLKVAPLPKEYAELPKRIQLERAASDLQGVQFGCDCGKSKSKGTYLRSFSPPLAVCFDSERVDEQGVCDLTGNCCLGCPKQAKRTLDLNYLQIAEGHRAEVRTLAEVTAVKQCRQEEDRAEGFTVTYRNLLQRNVVEVVHAKNVFLCAGAVNTTELLLRCRELKTLEPTGVGLGTRFHPNQDVLAAVFDCDEPQELDRGPTITASLSYDRLPGQDDPSARWRLGFTRARFEPKDGSEITCDSGAKVRIATPAYVISGSFKEQDALGELSVSKVRDDSRFLEDFAHGQRLWIDGVEWATVDTKPRQLRHWFLIQDGGLPTPVEPGLGVFRSPLWLGRNAFREQQRHPRDEEWPKSTNDGHDHDLHAAASKRNAFATLPFEAWTDLFSGFTRSAAGPQFHEISEYGLQLMRAPDRDARDREDREEPWRLVPGQLEHALGTLKKRVLDRLGLASEGVAAAFLEDAAKSIEPQLNEAVSKLDGIDPEQFSGLQLPARTLRLGIQLLWGSQGGLARAIADEAVSTILLGRGRLMEVTVEALKRLLDYRLGDGHTAMLLSMGLDSAPGRLELVLPTTGAGTELRGAESGTRAVILKIDVQEGALFCDQPVEGRVIITGQTGDFKAGETLLAGATMMGKYHEVEHTAAPESGEREESKQGDLVLDVRAVHFKADAPPSGRSVVSTAPLRAKLPEVIDTPERKIQERVLRDIASAWGGELRTSPLSTFVDRHVTVHAQGGCPMGKDETRGVTDVAGQVYGCPGLYVMDAAAFPGPVGANPSATIAAVAEYKAARFLKSRGCLKEGALEEKLANAATWVDQQGRNALDPLGPLGEVAPDPHSVEPAHRPVGIRFTEKMVGTVQGTSGLRAIETELTAKIDDLAGFLALHKRESDARVPIIEGTLKIGENEPLSIDPERSLMQVMVDRGLDESGREVRTIKYYLVPRGADEEKDRLDGSKVIRDDPGLDAWEDTTTLSFDLFELGKKHEGVLRLPAAEFFGGQVPSFEADTDDPARQVWAMLTFGHFFFGHLVDVYFPGLGQLGELAGSLLRRGHG
jgi:choline dehydrogenase-like flavoprotein